MSSIAAPIVPQHMLMQKRVEHASHDINKPKNATTSVFSDYLFGPLSGSNAGQSGATKASTPIANAKEAISSRQN